MTGVLRQIFWRGIAEDDFSSCTASPAATCVVYLCNSFRKGRQISSDATSIAVPLIGMRQITSTRKLRKDVAIRSRSIIP